MLISHRLKTIFIHVHRTGGTTLTNILLQSLKDEFEILPQHASLQNVDDDFLKKHHDYYIFGFTRNPWERIFSWYALIHQQDQRTFAEEKERFEEFVASDFTDASFHFNALDYFATKEVELINKHLFRYENLENEIKRLADRLGFKLNKIPTLNNTRARNYREYYTEKSRQLIANKCEKDIRYFNYEF